MGRTYGIDWETVSVVEPSGLEPILSQAGVGAMLVHVVGQTGSNLELALSLAGPDGEQSRCEPVHRLPEGAWLNPSFEVDARTFTITLGGRIVQLRDFVMGGRMRPDAGAWSDGTFQAQVDTRQLSRILPEGTDACAVLDALGSVCASCPDGVDACVRVALDEVSAVELGIAFDPELDTSGC